MITSLSNPKIKALMRYHQKKYRKDAYLLFSEELIKAARDKGLLKEVIGLQTPFEDLPFLAVSKDVMHKLAKGEDIAYIGLCQKAENELLEGDVLILDDVKDPSNIGLMIRSMAAFGFKSLVLSANCADVYDEKVLKVAGSSFYDINICHLDPLACIKQLEKSGYEVIATALKKRSIDFKELIIKKPCAFIMGNEGSGVKEELLDNVNIITKISMQDMDSLNVAIAASIVMHKAYISNRL